MHLTDFTTIIRNAWLDYDPSRIIESVADISAMVSTNHVYKITFPDQRFIIAKLSYFGKFEHFVEDHTIINSLSNNLMFPYASFLSRALMKGDKLFVYRYQSELIDAWVVFYRPVTVRTLLPRRLDERQIKKLGAELARFHQGCHLIRNTLPNSSKTLQSDLGQLLAIQATKFGQMELGIVPDEIRRQCESCLQNLEALQFDQLDKIPVFIDWNIGNFSVTAGFKLFSRWDYDWFRMSSRMLDFYFLSRVVSDIGDRTVFTYNIDVLMEDRFILFLKAYHKIYPFQENEIRLLKEVYRFFLLNYVIKDGRYFFHEIYATKLQREAYETHFPSVDRFDAEKILRALRI